MSNNILCQPFDTLYQTPPFEQINVESYLPAFNDLIVKAKEEINAIVSNPSAPDFNNTIESLEKSGSQLGIASHIFFNLNHAETNEQIQAIAREVSPLLTEYSNDIWLNDALFSKVKTVYEKQDRAVLSPEQVRLLE
ncbi:MAG: M3 family peptidase, partial [Carboxylicivirga sp.]|nr:M3 family peptidase [Carboxylicivirga sp.]